jgi:hypothetical protein
MPLTLHPRPLLKQRPTDWSINVKEGAGGAERWATSAQGALLILPSPLHWLLLETKGETQKAREKKQPGTEHLEAVPGR